MKLYQTSKIRGFTLVELAIVITIIGILIGGVLKGQQLIDQARLAATINQINNYRSALMIFKTTYNELPGDMVDPDARIVGCDGCGADSDYLGDTLVGRGQLGADLSKESEQVRYWLHLYKAGLLNGVTDAALTNEPSGIGTTFPAAKIGGGFYVQTAGYGGALGLCGSGSLYSMWNPDTNCMPSPGAVMFVHGLQGGYRLDLGGNWQIMTPMQAASMDRKMDDGRPLSGDVRGNSKSGGIYGCTNDDDAYPEAETNSKACTIGVLIEQ